MFFNKKSQTPPDTSVSSSMAPCSCKSEQGLFITNRHASWAVSLALIWSFFVFISGYFLGQRVVLEQFATRLEQDSLSDKIYSSLCTLYEVDNEAEVTDNEASSGAEGEGVECQEDDTPAMQTPAAQVIVKTDTSKPIEKQTKQYYAQLAGFGSAEHAYAFAQRCTQKNVKVVVKKKPSRSAKGRTHYWYQVVTHPYDDKEVLAAALNTIKRTEHIRDIRIREYTA